MGKRWMAVLLVVVSGLMFAACGGGKSSGSAQQELVVGFSVISLTDPANVLRVQGMKSVLDAEGIKLEITASDNDINKQIAGIEGFISKKVDAIIIQAIDSVALGSVVIEANKVGIPVILDDTSVKGGESFAFVTSDQYNTGLLPAQELARRLNGKGQVAYLDYPMVSSCRDREAGWDAAFSQSPGIKVVAKKLGGTADVNVSGVEDLLSAYPDLKAICCVNDLFALQALGVLKEKGKDKQVMIIGCGGIPEAITALKENPAFVATADQQTVLEGRVCAQQAVAAIRGEKPPEVHDIIIPTKLITPETAK